MTFSVLVAVYNAEKYLPNCLDSLIGQTLKDIQIICVDDASTDSSPDILRQYAGKDSRIEVITHSTNKGISAARNTALAAAKGTYTCFLDSDDWLSADALEQADAAFSKNPGADCVLFECMTVYDGREVLMRLPDFTTLTGRQAFTMSLDWTVHGIYAVRTELHKQYPYDASARTYTDENITRMHYLKSRLVARCKGIYYYRQHASSVTHAGTIRRLDFLKANMRMREMLLNENIDSATVARYENMRWLNVIDCYMTFFRNRKSWSRTDREKAVQMLHKAWLSIDTDAVRKRLLYKPGYMHLCSWRLFRWQEEAYFTAKKILNRW